MVAEPRKIADVKELLPLLTLDSIDFFEMSGRVEAGFTDSDADESAAEPAQTDVRVEVSPALRVRSDGIDARCRLRVHPPEGVIVVDGAAFYTSSEPIDVSQDVAVDFADNVAIMALFPYLRQAIDDLSVRLLFTNRVVLPILVRGQITFSEEAAGEGSA